MSHSRYVVCRTFHCDLKALNCFNEFSSRDRAMASLTLTQFRNFFGQAPNGILFGLLHGCNGSRIRGAQSMRCVESSMMRWPRLFKYLPSQVFSITANVHGSSRQDNPVLAHLQSKTVGNPFNPSSDSRRFIQSDPSNCLHSTYLITEPGMFILYPKSEDRAAADSVPSTR